MNLVFDRVRVALDFAATTAMLVAAVVLLWGSSRGRFVDGNSVAVARGGAADISGQNLKVTPDPSQRSGAPSAHVAVIEFADFECPYCASYAENTFPRIQTDLIAKGIASYTFMHCPLEAIHKRARTAAIAAICVAKQGRFWEIHESMFKRVKSLPTNSGLIQNSHLMQMSEILGGQFDAENFKECSKTANQDLTLQIREGDRLGVKGTPTFFVGKVLPDGQVELKRRLEGAVSFEVMSGVIKDVAGF